MRKVKRWCLFYLGSAQYFFTLKGVLDALEQYGLQSEDCSWYICGGETIIVDGE